MLFAGILVPLVLVMFRVQSVVPRSVLVLDPLLLLLIMGGSRFAYRMWREHLAGQNNHSETMWSVLTLLAFDEQ